MKTIDAKEPVWFNKRIINLNNKKNKVYKQFRRSNNDRQLYNQYRVLQKEFDTLNKFLYNQYLFSVESKLKSNSKSFWKFINDKKNSNGIPNRMRHDGITSSDLSVVCNLFAKHFQSVYLNDSSATSYVTNTNTSDSTLNIGYLSLSTSEIELALSQLKTDKRSDMDGIPPIILQLCAKALAIPLKIIFNRSLVCGEFLQKWKRSTITPIFKSGSRQEVSNYRPICKLSTIPKIFEKLVYDRLIPSLKRVISPYQHGFVAGRSTTTNLTIFCNLVLNGLENGSQYDVIYTDFSKAFDRVNHDVLLKKLNKVGFHSNFLNWINSYLRDRIQYVRINNVLSTPVYVTSGVPQGSHLGPLLFLLFVNDIPEIFLNSECLMYADDLKVFRCIKSKIDSLLLQEDLDKLSRWCTTNSLNLNISKCQSLTFCRNRSPVNFTYKIDQKELSVIHFKKDLGVIFDEKLNFIRHIDFLVAKGNSMLGFILRNSKEFCDPQTLKCLYFAFVRSNLEYCNTIWDPSYAVHSFRIEKIQKRFTRIVVKRLNWDIDMPSYETRCQLLGILPLNYRRKFTAIMFIRDILTDHIDCSQILALINFNVPMRMLRNPVFFKIPFHRTVYAANEPLSRCLREANSVCNMIDFNLSRYLFKSKLLLILNNFVGGNV